MLEVDNPERLREESAREFPGALEDHHQYEFLDFFNVSISALDLESSRLFGLDASDFYNINCGRLSRYLDHPHIYGLVSWAYFMARKTGSSQIIRLRGDARTLHKLHLYEALFHMSRMLVGTSGEQIMLLVLDCVGIFDSLFPDSILSVYLLFRDTDLVGARFMAERPSSDPLESLSVPDIAAFRKAEDELVRLGLEAETAQQICSQIRNVYLCMTRDFGSEDAGRVAAVPKTKFHFPLNETLRLALALNHCQVLLIRLLSDRCMSIIGEESLYFIGISSDKRRDDLFPIEMTTPSLEATLSFCLPGSEEVRGLRDLEKPPREWSVSFQSKMSSVPELACGKFFHVDLDTYCAILDIPIEESSSLKRLWQELGLRIDEVIVEDGEVTHSRDALIAILEFALELSQSQDATLQGEGFRPEQALEATPPDRELLHVKHLIERESEKHLRTFVGAFHSDRLTLRKVWVWFSCLCTLYVPEALLCSLGMVDPHVRTAWREKVALCMIISWISGLMLFLIMALPSLICPQQNILSTEELQSRGTLVIVHGIAYEVSSLIPKHSSGGATPSHILQFLGKDSSHLFPRPSNVIGHPLKSRKYHVGATGHAKYREIGHIPGAARDSNDFFYHSPEAYLILQAMPYSFLGMHPSTLKSGFSRAEAFISIRGSVYNVTRILLEGQTRLSSRAISALSPPWGVDKTALFQYSAAEADLDIMTDYFVAKLDLRASLNCLLSQYLLTAVTGILAVILLFKFLAALQLGQKRFPELSDKYVVILVPCYTESEELLRRTLDSITMLEYQSEMMLLFIVADGIMLNREDHRSVPQILLDILGTSSSQSKADIKEYEAISEDQCKSRNIASVYSGLYERAGRRIPYVLVTKIGMPLEIHNPGNRGKRDSQLILLRFLSQVIHQAPLNSLEQELYDHIHTRIGVEPSAYEYVMMIDADTEVHPESLNRLVSCCVHDARVIGICGETRLANERHSWITMIQVYEYYISHHLSKAFESLFGTVTCLPGCFCVYRLQMFKQDNTSIPLLLNKRLLDDYSETRIDTLHLKNLLSLGEDRYLTTLALKYFPKHKTKFTSDAVCLTTAPEGWAGLLSQRRRWINSTIHNLFELMMLPEMCGFCLFSMRFIVLVDLYATLVMPASVLYLTYLLVMALHSKSIPTTSLTLFALAYGLQTIIFLLKRQWQHIGWMLLYIASLPVFGVIIPLYAFWHFDEFSWGTVRNAHITRQFDA